MLNEFRTLLLNESFEGDYSEYIPFNFRQLELPEEFKEIDKILFAYDTRFYRKFMTYCYLKIIDGCGLSNDLKKFDNRIFYNLDNESPFFKFNRISNVISSNPAYELVVSGKYKASVLSGQFSEHFTVTQTGVQNQVQVHLNNANKSYYLNLVFNSFPSYTTNIALADTGLSLMFFAPGNLTVGLGLEWEFLVDSPYELNIEEILNNLEANRDKIDEVFKFTPKFDTTNYEALWNLHFNKLYRITGFLIAYVARISKFLEESAHHHINLVSTTTSTSSTTTSTTTPP